jgi:hypothetical protein
MEISSFQALCLLPEGTRKFPCLILQSREGECRARYIGTDDLGNRLNKARIVSLGYHEQMPTQPLIFISRRIWVKADPFKVNKFLIEHNVAELPPFHTGKSSELRQAFRGNVRGDAISCREGQPLTPYPFQISLPGAKNEGILCNEHLLNP